MTAAPPLRAGVGAHRGRLAACPRAAPRPTGRLRRRRRTGAAAPTARTLAPAQHDSALKALVPASVRISREKQAPPPTKRARTVGAVGAVGAATGGGSHPARPGAPRAGAAAPRGTTLRI